MDADPANLDVPQPGALSYRAFRLDGAGVVQSTEIIEAKTDDEAKAVARTLVNGCGVDLWERARFLASFPPITVGSSEG